MKAERVMKLEVVTVSPDVSVEQAHKVMKRLGVRHLPVVSEGRLAGMLSDRDILLVAGQDDQGQFVYPPLPVGQVMSLSPVSAGLAVPISELAKKMVEAKIDALPIVSAKKELIGLVTASDLLLLLTELPAEPRSSFSYEIRRFDDLHARA